MAITGTAIAGGYSVLMLSFGFNIHIWSGILIVLSMVVSVLTTLLLLSSPMDDEFFEEE